MTKEDYRVGDDLGCILNQMGEQGNKNGQDE